MWYKVTVGEREGNIYDNHHNLTRSKLSERNQDTNRISNFFGKGVTVGNHISVQLHSKCNYSHFLSVSNLVRSGRFRREDLPYLALDIQAKIKWKTIGKSLELTEAELNGIKTDNSEDYERCYEMLKIWCQRGDASYKVLADVLEKHRLQDIRENYCLVGYDPPLQETVAPGKLFASVLHKIHLNVF